MANPTLFASPTNHASNVKLTFNEAGGQAYKRSNEDIVAQLAVTGTLADTFYTTAEEQFTALMDAVKEVSPEYVAKVAVYARANGKMKDTPALLTAYLSIADPDLFSIVFPGIINTPRMLRTFVQIMRSGKVGRKSLGTRPKRLVKEWLEKASIVRLMEAATGNSPSLADIVKMVHPTPADDERRAFYGWLINKPYENDHLPDEIRAFEEWKKDRSLPLPNVPFRWLTTFELSTEDWTTIASRMGWSALRQNLNTLSRNGVFGDIAATSLIAEKLANPSAHAYSDILPYQLMVALKNVDNGVPLKVQSALEDVLEESLSRVPMMPGVTVVCPDVSGSMRSAVTGERKGSTSKVRCIDVAALMTASIVRNNKTSLILPFENRVVPIELNRNDRVAVTAKKLASVGGGGTAVSAPLALINAHNAHVDTVIIVSDNESWFDQSSRSGFRFSSQTAAMVEWTKIKSRCPKAKLICIDIQPHTTTQLASRSNILNIGGFSDDVYDQIAKFVSGEKTDWGTIVNTVEL